MMHKYQRLEQGLSFVTSEKGDSMKGLLKSGQKHQLVPTTWEQCEVGDIIYCKVRGNYYTHLVKGKNNEKGLLIGNNRGGINGWTKIVYGKVTHIF